ncbi:MAG TPA: DUF4328 domain-containing protein [Blastocatellia bacterium]|nr:DUF4328 domain-containing protein [Blastocatellia bacterium]
MMNQLDAVEPYEPLRTRAYLAIGFLAANIVTHLAAAASKVMQIDLLYKMIERLGDVTPAQVQANDVREAIVQLIVFVNLVAAGIVFLVWTYAAYKNLRALGANPDTSPGWAVGYFFIPIANLFRPFQVFQEMWRESDPETVAAGGGRPMHAFIEDSSKSLLIIVWWGLWLLSNIIPLIAVGYRGSAQLLNDFINASWISMVSDLVTILAAIACIMVIKKITDRQDERARRLAALAAAPTPPEGMSSSQPA